MKKILILFIFIYMVAGMDIYAESDMTEIDELFQDHKAVVLIIDPSDGRILRANNTAVLFYGYSEEELVSMSISDINALSGEEVQVEMEAAIEQKRNYFLFKHHLADGSVRDVEVYSSPYQFEGREVLVSIIHDVTDRIESERLNDLQNTFLLGMALFIIISLLVFSIYYRNSSREQQKLKSEFEFLSYHDQLTGLYNRLYFEKAIKSYDTPEHSPLSVAMVDVNGLKLTNDVFGHSIGDELLKVVASELVKRLSTVVSLPG